MKNIWFVAAAALSLSARSDVFVGQNEFADLVVDSQQTFAGRMVVSDQGEVVKFGEGTLVVPLSRVNQTWPLNTTVLGGAFRLEVDAAADLGAVRPAVMDVAAIWVSAADADETHFTAADNGGISRWYDVRETDVSAPRYLFAKTSTAFSDLSPERVTANGYKAVWFGGTGSGRAMNWYWPTDSRYKDKNVKHVFAVHGVVDSYGSIFSPGTDSGDACAFFTPLSYSYVYSVNNGYWRRDIEMPYMWNGRTWVDGERVDGHGAFSIAKGFHLLEADAGIWASSRTSGFFSQFKVKDYTGGDYLCEAVAFTNVLSEADRVQVGAYLMKKWFGRTCSEYKICVKSPAAFEIDSDSDEFGLRVDMSGNGNFVKRGAGSALYRATDWSAASTLAFVGEAHVSEGSLALASQLPVAVSAGQRVTAAIGGVGRVVTAAADADADEIIKDGDDELVVQSVPADVRKLKVQAGSLTLRAASAPAPSDRTLDVASVPNGDFEGFADTLLKDSDKPVELTSAETGGWKETGGATWMVNWMTWTGSFWGYRKDWNFYVPPVAGECVLMLNTGGSVATTVEIPSSGIWEFSCLRERRPIDSYMGGYAEVTLRDVSSEALVATFGRIYSNDSSARWKPVALRAKVQAGTYQLRIAHANNPNAMLIDDIKLRRVDAPECWPIPGGDFESASMATGYGARDFSSANTIEGWTFSSGESSLNPSAGLVSFAMTNSFGKGALYNDSRQPGGGFVMAYFRTDGSTASTEFTPPAGRHYLTADFAHRCDTSGSINAAVTIGGSSISLGTLDVTANSMTAMTFPTPFTTDGETPVTLTLTASESGDGIWADDFRLVERPDDGELVKSGSFEPLSPWVSVEEQGKVGHYLYKDWQDQLGTDIVHGEKYIMLWNRAGVKQTVSFPEPGVYRLSFWQHTRLGNHSHFGRNPVETFLIKDSVTNFIGRTEAVTHTNFVQHVFDFRVPEAGPYTFLMRGTETKNSMEAMIDGVSIVQVRHDPDAGAVLPETLRISVAQGARLRLDFDGTNNVDVLWLDGRRITGIVSAETHPEYISGYGTLNVQRVEHKGLQILVR